MNKRDFSDLSGGWMQSGDSNQQEKKRRRKSRWQSDPDDKAMLSTVIPAGLNKEQEEQYLVQLQIEEISRRLRSGDLGIPANPEDRSPSPEPIYNNEGKRLNTREYRTRKKLEEDRHRLVLRAQELNTEYKPPADYKPPVIRVNDKVMIPQEEHPDINFVGLLIGPRGNTLKNLEKDTGAKIIIRGKGSVKEGKIGRKDGQPLPGEDEPLHAYVTANNPEHVKKAVEKIKEIIRQGIEVPEGQNDLRRQQLRELALLNGTLRENDALGKLKQIQQAQTIITNTILCTLCGGAGHIAQDCKSKKPGETLRQMQNQMTNQTPADRAKMDSEYMSLMAELGEGPPPPKQNTMQQAPQRPQFSSMPPIGAPTSSSQWQQPPPSTGIRPPPSMVGPPQNNHLGPPSSMSTSQHGPMMSVPPPMSSAGPVPPPWSQPPPQASSAPPVSMPNVSMTTSFRESQKLIDDSS